MKKAKIITIAEIKGGTGKTTTAAAIAQAAIAEGKKVLVIDLDPQANITTLFNGSMRKPGTFALLRANGIIKDCIQTTKQGVDLIAGAPDLYTIKAERGGIYDLDYKLVPVVNSYDLIIIDTPPALNALTFNAMQASTGLIIPCSLDMGSADGLLLVLDYAAQIKATNKKLKVLGCLITQYDNRPNIHRKLRKLIEDAAKAKKCPYLGEIRKGVSIQEAAAYGKNLFTYAPKSKPAQDYKAIYDYLTETKAI